MSEAALAPDAFVAQLREEATRRYHDKHAFHVAMHRGELTKEQLQAWTRNRYYYQTRIPIKDALILSKSEDPVFRRAWIRRIHDHDDEGGGLELWLRLADGVGLDRAEVASCSGVPMVVWKVNVGTRPNQAVDDVRCLSERKSGA